MFLGSKVRLCVGLTTLPPSMSRLSRQCGIINISTACYGDSFYFFIMNTHVGTEVELQAFLTRALDTGVCGASRPEWVPGTHCIRGLIFPQDGPGCCRESKHTPTGMIFSLIAWLWLMIGCPNVHAILGSLCGTTCNFITSCGCPSVSDIADSSVRRDMLCMKHILWFMALLLAQTIC
jgi:hypothetical protein